ncbi:nucleoside monophosphate kinase, partial [Candidatus Woesearchaeota archaeon]|nr:nucleoside monophosphate kinase [Candidatus Woesearchaeota archaeon]
DDITNAMVKNRLLQKDCSEGYILDGYPRTIPQAKFLDTIQDIDKVIFFALNDEEIIRRLSGRAKQEGRKDDTPSIIKNRLGVYKKQTQPLIDYYKKKGIIIRVDAGPSIDKISNKVLAKINQKN